MIVAALRYNQLQSQTKELGHEASSPLTPLSMLIIGVVIFSLFVGKNAIFSNIDLGGWGIRDTACVPISFGRDCSSQAERTKKEIKIISKNQYLTIIRRRRGEYCRIIPETKSRGLFDNIHRA